MRERLLAFGLLKKPVSQRERRDVQVRGGLPSRAGSSLDQPVGANRPLPRRDDVPREQRSPEKGLGAARPPRSYDRKTLYDQVWSQPVQVVAKSYGVSGVALARTCRKLHVPVPPRGYWARIRTRPEGEKTALASGEMRQPGRTTSRSPSDRHRDHGVVRSGRREDRFHFASPYLFGHTAEQVLQNQSTGPIEKVGSSRRELRGGKIRSDAIRL